jgi:hypothetical protein
MITDRCSGVCRYTLVRREFDKYSTVTRSSSNTFRRIGCFPGGVHGAATQSLAIEAVRCGSLSGRRQRSTLCGRKCGCKRRVGSRVGGARCAAGALVPGDDPIPRHSRRLSECLNRPTPGPASSSSVRENPNLSQIFGAGSLCCFLSSMFRVVLDFSNPHIG